MKRGSLLVLVLLLGGLFLGNFGPTLAAEETSRYFPETGKTVSGKFLEYWQNNGGLAVFGYPITDSQPEVDPETYKKFETQWFERNRFELHPENVRTPFEVLLGLLGKDLRRQALAVDPDFRRAGALIDPTKPKEQQWYFDQTGHNLRFRFLEYWLQNGGLERFGYPIGEEFDEVDPETGKVFRSQWFERARFELHTENQAPYDVLLGLLGNQIKAPKSKAEFSWKIGGGYEQFFLPGNIASDKQGNIYICDTLNNRILKYDPAGRILAQWGSKGQDNGKFSFEGNSAIAVDSLGNVYVADVYIANIRLQKFDSNGQFIAKWDKHGDGANEFRRIRQMAVDKLGNVFIADDITNRIQKFDNNLNILNISSNFFDNTTNRIQPAGLALDGQGNVFAADVSLSRILKYDNNLNPLVAWGVKGSGDGQFSPAYTNSSSFLALPLAVDGTGNVYVGDSGNNRVEKFDGNGTFLLKWSGAGDNQINLLNSLTADPAGNIYTGELYNRLQKFDSTGNFLGKWGKQFDDPGQLNPNLFGGPIGIALNRQGNIYVADVGNHRIQKFRGNGEFEFAFGNSGKGDGQFGSSTSPLNIAIDGLNYVYVADPANSRVQKFGSDGSFQLKFGSVGNGDGQFNGQYNGQTDDLLSLATSKDGTDNLYVLDKNANRVQKFDSQGHFISKFGTLGLSPGQFSSPNALVIDSKGNFYVADDFRIQKFDKNWNYLTTFGNGGKALTMDAADNLYVYGTSNFKIWKFDSSGIFQFDWGGQGTANGLFDGFFAPGGYRGIAVDSSGYYLYVTDPRNSRVQAFHLH